MTPRDGSSTQRSWRAPRQDGGRLIDPPENQLGQVLAANQELLRRDDFELLGQRRSVFMPAARRELCVRARAYTLQYRSVSTDGSVAERGPLILAGHQPELFHPGVWYKNYALARFAQQSRAWAINLIIDNDLLHTPAIRVLSGTRKSPQVVRVPFDRSTVPLPYEERLVLDPSLFDSFADRVEQAVAPWVADPLVRTLWPHARRAAAERQQLGASLAQARHRLEADWHLPTWEIPLSVVCQSDAFRRFVGELLVQLPRFARVYNESLWEYRRVNRIRSRTHPVPELVRDGDWQEAPFWIWTSQQPERRRLFVRPVAEGWQLTDRRQTWPFLGHQDRGSELIARLQQLEQQGVKLRPRALTTTLFARLCLSDLFLHGIGGAKYDQLTDQIMQQFWNLTPPTYYAISATAWLPVERPADPNPELEMWRHRQRDLVFHAEKFLPAAGEANTWIEQKQIWIRQADPTRQRERHLALQQINQHLQTFVVPQQEQTLQRLAQLRTEQQRWKILTSREYSFCLFPESTLRRILLGG